MRTQHLITAAELDELRRRSVVRVLDVRWRLDRPDGRDDFRAGRIPGSVYVDLGGELAAHGRPASEGRHPLPPVAELEASARRWGLRDGDAVVVLDDLGGMSAARAWWLLRDAGIPDVRVLDGGLRAWRDAGLPIESGEPELPEVGDIVLHRGALPVLDEDEAARLADEGRLLDARAGERFRGEVEPIDPRAGHIPGAVSAPTAALLDEAGRFRSTDELRAVFADHGADDARPVGVYCGSGVTAAHTVLALAVVGVDAALYPGSWSAWSNQPERAVATGP